VDIIWNWAVEMKNEHGQTVVEYILLLAVSVSLVVTIFRSQAFKSLFGTQGSVGKLYKQESEWGYRHAFTVGKTPGEQPIPYPSAEQHPSYYNFSVSESRFFGPSDPYQ
jgi:hypothetical protein